MNIGVVSCGGDSPGMNAAIRAIVRQGIGLGCRMLGFKYGYDGIIDGQYQELGLASVAGILDLGGTWLGTGRSERFRTEEGQQAALESLRLLKVDGLVVIGGDGSLRGAHALCQKGFPVVGIPGTIDNDVYGTEVTIGFDTCLNTILDALSKLRDTASSHNRVFVVEVMGRESGELAVNSALAGGAEVVAIPECGMPKEAAWQAVEYGQRRGKLHTIVVVAEGACSADEMAAHLQQQLQDHEVRKSVLGHIQRGGRPTARDRILASRMGATAVKALVEGKSDVMVGVQADKMVLVPLAEVINGRKKLDSSLLELVSTLAL
ncbi:MAG: 6-phosphofructokinase [Thermoleophilia bacterium]|nr:6-phosphofructokinase [Thermoleophilia bacterium]